MSGIEGTSATTTPETSLTRTFNLDLAQSECLLRVAIRMEREGLSIQDALAVLSTELVYTDSLIALPEEQREQAAKQAADQLEKIFNLLGRIPEERRDNIRQICLFKQVNHEKYREILLEVENVASGVPKNRQYIPRWDYKEIALLIDAAARVKKGEDRKRVVYRLSRGLRRRLAAKGCPMGLVTRNYAGIHLQLNYLEKYLENGVSEKIGSHFMAMVALQKADSVLFQEILDDARHELLG